MSGLNRTHLAITLTLTLLLSTLLAGTPGGAEADTANTPDSRATPWEPVGTVSTTVQIDAGDHFYVSFDPETLELSAMPAYDLPDECDQAIAMVPEWLRGNLTYKFRQLDAVHQVEFANEIIDSPDPKWVDEIAFAIAHSSVETLQHQYMFPGVYTDNAKYVYENDKYLDYVEIVEKGDHTTVAYKNATNQSNEVPRDIYYWYIVHPKVSDELPTYVDPDYNYATMSPGSRDYGVAPPTGKFWRQWLFHENDTGYPLLKERLENRWTIYDAVAGLNSWVSGSLSFTSDSERPIQPVRIYRKHIGRCGEHQDMRASAGRAALLPVTCALNIAEDHVWNEFWDGRWIHWDGDYDNAMKYENGWGKRISTVWNYRGDGHVWSVSPKYTETCTFTASVKDSAGLPVDGASIMMATENYYDPQYLTYSTWGYTDYSGKYVVPLGDQRNFWSSADTENLGEDPADSGGNERVTQVITDTVADQTYNYDFNLPQAAASLKGGPATPPEDANNRFRMRGGYSVRSNILQGENFFSGGHCDVWGGGGAIDFFFADSQNFGDYRDDQSFDGYGIEERGNTSDVSFVVPSSDDVWYAVLSNTFSQRTTMLVNITLTVDAYITGELTSHTEGEQLELDSVAVLAGTAFSPLELQSVEVSVDGGAWDDGASFALNTTLGRTWDWWYFWDTAGLDPGSHTLQVRFTDTAHSALITRNVTLVDVTPPSVSLDEPLDGARFSIGDPIVVSGTADDNVGVAVLGLLLDGDTTSPVDILPGLAAGAWSQGFDTSDWSDGDHAIMVRAVDAAGLANTSAVTVTLVEVTAPTVAFTEPADNSLHRLGDEILIEGKAADNKRVSLLHLIFDDGEPVNITSDMGSSSGVFAFYWDTSAGDLEGGVHTLKAVAYDEAGNSGSAELSLVLDGAPPEVGITGPARYSLWRAGDDVLVEGTALDNIGIVGLELSVDGGKDRDILDELDGDGWWEYELDTSRLGSGPHEITVLARDEMGHEAQFSLPIAVDAQDPVVYITEKPRKVEPGDVATFEGRATDDIMVGSVRIVMDDGDSVDITAGYDNDTGVWSYEWDSEGAQEGDLDFIIIVTDIVGREASKEFTVEVVPPEDDTPDGGDGNGTDDGGDLNTSGSSGDREGDGSDLGIILTLVAVIIAVVVALLLSMMMRKKGPAEESLYDAPVEGPVSTAGKVTGVTLMPAGEAAGPASSTGPPGPPKGPDTASGPVPALLPPPADAPALPPGPDAPTA